MKLIRTACTAVFAAGLLLAGPAFSSAQQPAKDQTPDRAPEPAAITGELTRVNPQAMTFSVKNASGAEMQFRFDAKTIIAGAQRNVAGLATSSGSQVTVSYRNDSAGNMALKIEVHAKT